MANRPDILCELLNRLNMTQRAAFVLYLYDLIWPGLSDECKRLRPFFEDELPVIDNLDVVPVLNDDENKIDESLLDLLTWPGYPAEDDLLDIVIGVCARVADLAQPADDMDWDDVYYRTRFELIVYAASLLEDEYRSTVRFMVDFKGKDK